MDKDDRSSTSESEAEQWSDSKEEVHVGHESKTSSRLQSLTSDLLADDAYTLKQNFVFVPPLFVCLSHLSQVI